MSWYDWAVIATTVALCVRGWIKGALREMIDIGLLLVGTLIAFRLSPALGSVIGGMANVPYEVARVVAGAVVLTVLVAGSMVLGRFIAKALHVLPGANWINRAGGAAIGFVYAAVLVVLATTLLAAISLPESVSAAVEESIDDSVVGSTVTDPAGAVQPIVAALSGEDLFGAVIAVRSVVGDRLSTGTIPIPFPPADSADLAPSQVKAQLVFDEMNRRRIADGQDPLAWSADLAVVAVARASDVYRSGWLSLDDQLGDALKAAGIPGTISTDMVVLAASPDGVVEAITSASDYDARVLDGAYRKAGVGIIEGPYGLIAVQVLSA